MKKWLTLSLLIINQFLFNPLVFGMPLPSEQSLDRIIVVINSSVITQQELNQAIEKIKKQLIANHTSLPNQTLFRKQVLDQLINRTLQLDLARQSGIRVKDAQIDKAIERIAENNHISTEKLYDEIKKQGLSIKDYREEIHDEYTIHKIQQHMIANKIMISQEEVDDFMKSSAWRSLSAKEYHLEDILITLPDAPSTEQVTHAKKRAEILVAKLHQGLNFSQAAVAESGSNQPLQQAGDLGWRKLPEIPSAFSDTLIHSKENDIFGPIQTPNGFHIIHVAGIRQVGMEGSTAEQRKKIQELLYERKYEEALQSWITKLRSESFIQVIDEA